MGFYTLGDNMSSKIALKYIIGTKVHQLEIISTPYHKIIRDKKILYVDCKCICGVTKPIRLHDLEIYQSCGCRRKDTSHLRNHDFARKGTLLDKDGYKVCSKCKCKYKGQCFTKHKLTKDGLNSSCNHCATIKNQFHDYGITREQYNKLLEKQNNSCACCKINQKDLHKLLSVDHCHKTGKIRGLICNNCNLGIGSLGDNKEGIWKAYQYLLTSEANTDTIGLSDKNITTTEVNDEACQRTVECRAV
jgi:hypothetical protein